MHAEPRDAQVQGGWYTMAGQKKQELLLLSDNTLVSNLDGKMYPAGSEVLPDGTIKCGAVDMMSAMMQMAGCALRYCARQCRAAALSEYVRLPRCERTQREYHPYSRPSFWSGSQHYYQYQSWSRADRIRSDRQKRGSNKGGAAAL